VPPSLSSVGMQDRHPTAIFSAPKADSATIYVAWCLRADPNFDACYIPDSGTYDPSCADGFSAVVPLTVPRPTIHYVGSAIVYKYLGQISLELSASPLGVKQRYKVCYPLKTKARRCLNGTVDGYHWNSPGVGRLSLTTRGLAARTTFTWFVDRAKVAARTVRAR
jgi:hypothetical protein